jgi:hypothetical protein
MWFLCVLFGFASSDKAASINEWQTAALARIATKTPPFVVEEAQDYPASDIEYNPVIRKDYAQTVQPSPSNKRLSLILISFQGNGEAQSHPDSAHFPPCARSTIALTSPGHLRFGPS